ncbi:regulator of telomere elongation helicase 1 [Stylonychia lemnae]|uniref:Regulator of telomere elongation helicase 1 n=1 Tax=Stylonychia lemnae TaxID=5949 RepID=A0A078B9S8_STYLE|nr:regulator of telomere elongation helicase 1 [Stylonychia lemnae]|eukprot:CDW90951.1 regulator of telomere elongation helicase 1 [Stylonychia lemnae]
MMRAVIECVKNKQNGLIESPTGTGKTLSIICSAVAALSYLRKHKEKYKVVKKKQDKKEQVIIDEEENKEKINQRLNGEENEVDEIEYDVPTRIVYCTRTHSQINQIFDELKNKLPYILRISPFASRKHSCIFENLPEQFPGNALNLSCKLLRKLDTIKQKLNKDASLKLTKLKDSNIKDIEDSGVDVQIIKSGCTFFYGYNYEVKKSASQELQNQFGAANCSTSKPAKSINYVAQQLPWNQPLSVNDYNKLGRINNTCPYYMMRSRVQECDLAVIPYNYIIDKNLRAQVNIPLKGSIIVLDEGHNIDSFCEELFTFEISINELFQDYQLLNQIWLDLQAEEQLLSEHQRYMVKGQRVDTKALQFTSEFEYLQIARIIFFVCNGVREIER